MTAAATSWDGDRLAVWSRTASRRRTSRRRQKTCEALLGPALQTVERSEAYLLASDRLHTQTPPYPVQNRIRSEDVGQSSKSLTPLIDFRLHELLSCNQSLHKLEQMAHPTIKRLLMHTFAL